jgi:hypothetical protein
LSTGPVTTPTAGSAATAFVGFFYNQLFFSKGNIFQHFNCFPGIFIFRHFYKAKTAAFARGFVNGNLGRRRLPKFFKDFHQLRIIHVIREACNKKFHTKIYGLKIRTYAGQDGFKKVFSFSGKWSHAIKNVSSQRLSWQAITLAIFYKVEQQPKPVVIYAHGLNCFKDWATLIWCHTSCRGRI